MHGECGLGVEVHLRAATKYLVNYHGQRNSIARQYLFDLCGRISPNIAVQVGGIRYFLSTADREVSRKTFISGGFEQEKVSQTLRLIEERTGQSVVGKEWIDIGANIGTTTVPAVRLFGAAHVWAFEPSPDNVTLLMCNVIANSISEQVTVLPIALSNVTGPAVLELSPDSWGDHRIVTSTMDGLFHEASRSHVCVRAETFDQIARERGISMDRVGLVWMDTQGHEGRILEGAAVIFESSVPVLTEYWPYGLGRAGCLDSFNDLVARHYSWIIDIGSPGGVREFPAAHVGRLQTNYEGLSYTDLLLL